MTSLGLCLLVGGIISLLIGAFILGAHMGISWERDCKEYDEEYEHLMERDLCRTSKIAPLTRD